MRSLFSLFSNQFLLSKERCILINDMIWKGAYLNSKERQSFNKKINSNPLNKKYSWGNEAIKSIIKE